MNPMKGQRQKKRLAKTKNPRGFAQFQLRRCLGTSSRHRRQTCQSEHNTSKTRATRIVLTKYERPVPFWKLEWGKGGKTVELMLSRSVHDILNNIASQRRKKDPGGKSKALASCQSRTDDLVITSDTLYR